MMPIGHARECLSITNSSKGTTNRGLPWTPDPRNLMLGEHITPHSLGVESPHALPWDCGITVQNISSTQRTCASKWVEPADQYTMTCSRQNQKPFYLLVRTNWLFQGMSISSLNFKFHILSKTDVMWVLC